jgi:proline dehydrogenase
MGIARSALLWVSENRTLRTTLPKARFVRRAVKRFMPGEELEDALRAAEELRTASIGTIFTHLGENIADAGEAKRVAEHYVRMLESIRERGLDTCASVKLTQLGLDIDQALCLEHVRSIAAKAAGIGTMLWIDIEQSSYVDRTLGVYRELRPAFPNLGVCLQSYLYRTMDDLVSLLPLEPAIRIVKGAYKEPPSVAYPHKADVDENYFSLAALMLENRPRRKVTIGIGTHDTVLLGRIQDEAVRLGLTKDAYEVQMLYGIKAETQLRLAREQYRVRSLISYGSFWFPWYVRRLAERPANVGFVVRSMFTR